MYMAQSLSELCNNKDCRLIKGHKGGHNRFPTTAWGFMNKKDKNKIVKAGFATPRGGEKGAYQNHVVRSNKVIIPFEKLRVTDLSLYKDGYVIKLSPEQYFKSKFTPKDEFTKSDSSIKVGENAFILYRSYESFEKYPPLKEWFIRYLEKEGSKVEKRGKEVEDKGHYVLRLPTLGSKNKKFEGYPQGLFAIEYADKETNYLCKCVLAWLVIHTEGSPYTSTQADHLQAILKKEKLLDQRQFEFRGVLSHGLSCCPLCLEILNYRELHEIIGFEEIEALENAGIQVPGATRSTIVNLFHLEPLTYDSIKHIPVNMAWGHAICNTKLGQRRCVSLSELKKLDLKVGIIRPEGIETFGWISEDKKFIRGPNGSVWIQIN